jgi:hypothetical protein
MWTSLRLRIARWVLKGTSYIVVRRLVMDGAIAWEIRPDDMGHIGSYVLRDDRGENHDE